MPGHEWLACERNLGADVKQNSLQLHFRQVFGTGQVRCEISSMDVVKVFMPSGNKLMFGAVVYTYSVRLYVRRSREKN